MWPFSKRRDPIKELWEWFTRNSVRFEAEEPDLDAYRQLTSLVKEIDHGLTYEIARAATWDLAISADGAPELIPAVEAVLEHAPVINGWSFTPFRGPSAQPPTITVFDQELSVDNVFFTVEKEKAAALDLVIYMPGIGDENARHMSDCATLLLESLIGELAVMTRIGEIAYESMDGVPAEAIRLAELPNRLKIGPNP